VSITAARSADVLVSNTIVDRLAYRLVMPVAMLAVLFLILRTAEREQRAWIAQRASAHQKTIDATDIESIPFVLPFQHSATVQDAIGFQWPAFAVAGIIAPVPQLFYSERNPIALTHTSYVALALAVGIYWFVIAVWVDRRLIQRKEPIHSKVVRIVLTVAFVLIALFLLVFLGKDLVAGWPEGPQGAYGITVWLALVCTILLTELRGFHRRRVATPRP